MYRTHFFKALTKVPEIIYIIREKNIVYKKNLLRVKNKIVFLIFKSEKINEKFRKGKILTRQTFHLSTPIFLLIIPIN